VTWQTSLIACKEFIGICRYGLCRCVLKIMAWFSTVWGRDSRWRWQSKRMRSVRNEQIAARFREEERRTPVSSISLWD
jgi:hypothetical protein